MDNEVFSGGEMNAAELSPEERFISRYATLRSKLGEPALSKEERQEIATELIDLRRILERGDIASDLALEMSKQIERLEKIFILERRLKEASRTLERESRGNIQVPHVYADTARLFTEAESIGISERILGYYRPVLERYLAMIRENARGKP